MSKYAEALAGHSIGGSHVPETSKTAQATAAVPQTRPPAPAGFEEFFRASFRELVKAAMAVGATLEEAKDAAQDAMAELLPKYSAVKYPLTYARKAAVHNFIKAKQRGTLRVALRLIERGHVPHQEGAEDSQLTACEEHQAVTELLTRGLPPAQREVMTCVALGLGRDEISDVLGKTTDTIRRHLCDAREHLARVLHPQPEPEQARRPAARTPREEEAR